MESSNRSFLLFVLSSLVILLAAGWYLKSVLGEAAIQQQGSDQKTQLFLQEFGVGSTLDDLNQKYAEQITREAKRLHDYRSTVAFAFPDWVKKGDEITRHGERGEYFLQEKAREIGRLINLCGPQCDIDVSAVIEHLGFSSSSAPTDDQAPTDLRRLAIITKTIDLAAHAKLEQLQADQKDQIKSTAFLKIVSIEPLDPEFTGAVRLDPNPKFRENSYNNPRFLVIQYPYFMTEYPIDLKMVCDINTFRRFLTSSRRPNEYLIIRNIRIRSNTLKYSPEGASDLPMELTDQSIPDDIGSELVFIELSAAGVEFLDGHRYEEGVTQPLDLNDYLKGFQPKLALPGGPGSPGHAKPVPVGA